MIKIDWNAMPNLSELTLVVPTYNRQQHALKQMRFWSGSPVTLHILDGTNKPIKNEKLKDIEDNVQYHHLPCIFEERVGKAIKFIDTPYVAFLSDDEYFIPSALEHCIEYLKNNKDFAACIGICMGFHSAKKGLYGRPMYDSWKGTGCFEETSGERIIAKMKQNDSPVYYSVQRADIWKQSIALLPKHRFSSPWVQEFQFEIAICYQGKSIVLNELMWLRNTETGHVTYNKWNRKLDFETWMKEPQYTDEVNIMYENTTNDLASIYGVDKQIVLKEVKASVDAYMDRIKKRKMITLPAMVRSKVMRFVPKKTKKLLNLARVTLTWKPMMKVAELMEKDGVNVDLKQLYEIVEFMEKKL